MLFVTLIGLLSACSSDTSSTPSTTGVLADETTPLTPPTFLETNASKEGVTTSSSGLQYEVLTENEGSSPTITSTVTLHYVGTLTDGTQFDSSRERGEAATFALSGVIAGFAEGVQLMSVGDVYRFVMPYHLAYGAQGNGSSIAPYATLIFEVELLEINSL